MKKHAFETNEHHIPDLCSDDFFRYTLYSQHDPHQTYQEISLKFNTLSEALTQHLKAFSLHSLSLLFSYPYFEKNFHPLLKKEIQALRNNWLLSKCDPGALSGLDSKSLEHYFLSLDEEQFQLYKSLFSQTNGWIKKEFYLLRKRCLFQMIQKNKKILIFFFFIAVGLAATLTIQTANNSFTIWDLIRGWFAFLSK